jgi:hypothetical protein
MLTVVIAKHDIQQEQSNESRTLTPAQDLENEERGEHAHHTRPAGDGAADTAENNTETKREELERQTFEISSGEFEVIKMNIVEMVKKQWMEGRPTAANGQRLGAQPTNRDGAAVPQ